MPMTHPVNLPASLGGFLFKGVHSLIYGVRQTPGDRILMPTYERNLINIPGNSTAFVQSSGSYEPRVETITCSYALREGENVYTQARQIAQWLDGVGELTYAYEPNKHYRAYLSSAPPVVKQLEYATFDLEFTCDPPFAYENEITIIQGTTYIETSEFGPPFNGAAVATLDFINPGTTDDTEWTLEVYGLRGFDVVTVESTFGVKFVNSKDDPISSGIGLMTDVMRIYNIFTFHMVFDAKTLDFYYQPDPVNSKFVRFLDVTSRFPPIKPGRNIINVFSKTVNPEYTFVVNLKYRPRYL